MVSKFSPEVNKVYFINQYTLFHIMEGKGAIQVDFKNYFDWNDKLIFLDKGQYIKFLAEDFLVRKIEFEQEVIFKNKDVRVLFKHLVSLGYINFQECDECQKYLSDTLLTRPKNIIDVSANQWYWQNPFNANAQEYQVIFDLKDVIDQQFKNHLTSAELVKILGGNDKSVHTLIKDKIGITVKKLVSKKRLTEGQKEIAFTNKSIKEIAYELGYKDPAYFNRSFKKDTGLTPDEFRKTNTFNEGDDFTQELFDLLSEFHTSQRNTSFYAKKLYISEKTLSKKVRQKFNISIGQLIRHEIIKTAKRYLLEGRPVKETAFALGFEEANHFSTFFKHYTKLTPSEFLSKKYNQ